MSNFPPPYTEEDERLAEAIVDKAMEKYRKLLPEAVVADMRDYLVDELLATEDGRRKLRAFTAHDAALKPSGDEERFPGIEAPPAKKEPNQA